MRSTFSMEMTWVPKAAPHEIVPPIDGQDAHQAFGKRYIKPIRRWMDQAGYRAFTVHLDGLHRCFSDTQTYTIEITPTGYCDTTTLDNEKARAEFTRYLQCLFDGLRDRFDLVPQVITRKGGTETHWPGGGLHVHYGAGFIGGGASTWYDRMRRFHTNLAVDFANRPYLRWLFAQWFADEGSTCIVDERILKQGHLPWLCAPITREQIVNASSCVVARWLSSIHGDHKSPYFTFELRNLFGMPKDAAQVVLCARFVHAWMSRVYEDTIKGTDYPFVLTLDGLHAMGDGRKAWGLCRDALTALNLTAAQYRAFYDDNYIKRIRFGKLV